MNKAISLYFDFGSPTTYLAYHRLKQVSDTYKVDVVLKPVLLGGLFKGAGNSSPAMVPLKSQWMNIDLQRYAHRYGVEFNHNPFFPINTLTLMRTALVALELGCLEHYVETVFNAMWREPKNLGDLDILTDVLNNTELDARKLLEGAQQPHIKEDLKSRTTEALELGLFGCPAMFYDGEFFFGQDRIFFIEEMIQNERDSENRA